MYKGSVGRLNCAISQLVRERLAIAGATVEPHYAGLAICTFSQIVLDLAA